MPIEYDKKENLNSIVGFIEESGSKKANLLVLPGNLPSRAIVGMLNHSTIMNRENIILKALNLSRVRREKSLQTTPKR